MGWPFFTRTPRPTPSDAARTLAAIAERQREAANVAVAERRARIVAELRRSGAVSSLPPRDEVVASIRAARAHRREKSNG